MCMHEGGWIWISADKFFLNCFDRFLIVFFSLFEGDDHKLETDINHGGILQIFPISLCKLLGITKFIMSLAVVVRNDLQNNV